MRNSVSLCLIAMSLAGSASAQTAPAAPEPVVPEPVVIVNPAPEGVVSTPVGNLPEGALQVWNIGAIGLTIVSLINLASKTESSGSTF